jgi:hypothetical protein
MYESQFSITSNVTEFPVETESSLEILSNIANAEDTEHAIVEPVTQGS